MRQSRIEHVPALDGLRGAAVAAVLLFHGEHLTGGYLGVDLFFTLSGYLITALLLSEVVATGAVALGSFWARRARRLLPAIGVLMIGIAAYALLIARSDELTRIRFDGIWTLLYGANWRAITSHTSYWGLFSAPSPLQHTWSLAIEEQFYVIWPLVVFAIARLNREIAARRVVVVALVGAVVGSAWMIASYSPTDSSRSYFGTDTRVASILFGAALAALLAWKPQVLSSSPFALKSLTFLSFAAVATLALMWTRLNGQDNLLYRGGFLAAAVCATIIIAAVVSNRRGVLNTVFALLPLRMLGLLSYGAYLYHWPIFAVMSPHRVGFGGWPLFGLRVATTLLAAAISYRFIEQPIRHGRGASWTTVILSISAAVIAVAVLLFATVGARPLINPHDGASEATATGVHRAELNPHAQRLMLAGSSIAALLQEPLRTASNPQRLVILNRAFIGCAFPRGATRVKFPGSAPQSAGRACGTTWPGDIATFHPNAVLYIPGRAPRGDVVEVGGKFLTPCTPPHRAVYEQSLQHDIAALSANGTAVYVPTFAYQLDRDDEPKWQATTDCVNASIRKIVSSIRGVRLVDIAAHTCTDSQHCTINSHGVRIRPDGLHFHEAGATDFAKWLLSEMSLPTTPR